MTNRFMMSVAVAALIAGTGFANAQGTGGTNREGGAAAGGATTQQAAPSSATPMNRDSASDSKGSDKGMKSTQSDEKPAAKTTQSDEKMQPPGAKSQRAQDDLKAGPKGEKSAQDNNMKGEKSKSMSSETQEKGPAAKDMKAEGRNDNKNAETKGAADKNLNADSKGAADSKATTTTGQAGAGAKLSTEQRTKITTVIKSQHVQPLNNVNFSISVGTRIPRGVSFHPLPAEVVTYYPEWRGYEFILVGDQIVVVDPRTLEIVAVIEA
jgi:Protein of unknown function (DUF1236)